VHPRGTLTKGMLPSHCMRSGNVKTKTIETGIRPKGTKDRGASLAVSAVDLLACAWPSLLLATICLLPYLNKPFLVDDPHFLTMARQIVKHPMHPMDFDICWNMSANCTKAYLLTPGNALMGYVLVPTVLGGAHEWMAHLTQLVLVWIAVMAMTSLVLRLGWDRHHAIAGALLLVAVPPFLPMASTAIPDILATAVALVAMERLAAWKADPKWRYGVAAAIALGLAGFARPHLALLIPLAAFFLTESMNPGAILEQIRRKFWLWIPVVAGTILLLAIIAATREHNLAVSPPSAVTGTQHARNNLRSYLLYFVFPLPLAVCWLANRVKNGRWLIASIVTGLAVASLFSGYGHQDRLASSFAIVGFGMLADLLFEALRKRDHTGLFLLLWILIPLPIVFYVHLPMKYLVPCLPAVILLCFRLMDGFSVRVARAAAFALIVASTSYSLLILRSDAEFAEFGRDALYSLIQPRIAAGETVWFTQQFSSYWYAPLAGAKLTFPGGPQPIPGDLLVVGRYGGEDLALARFPHRTLVETTSHKYRYGRTMGGGIGLYTNLVGYWLWGFGDSPDDRYELWRID
jgi:4-amino-4-deoxy-L-arabinose transferase-like glycosyltransferase